MVAIKTVNYKSPANRSTDSIKGLEDRIKELGKKIGDFHKCHTCNKSFKSKDINRHKANCFAEESEVTKVGRQLVNGRRLSFKCKSCNKSFTNKANLHEHEKDCAFSDVEEDDDDTPRVVKDLNPHIHNSKKDGIACKDCDLSFTHPRMLQAHKAGNQCNGGSASTPAVSKGNKTVNTSAFDCKSCNRSFSSRPELKNHELTHFQGAARTFACKKCKKRFMAKGLLKVHEASCIFSQNGISLPMEDPETSRESSTNKEGAHTAFVAATKEALDKVEESVSTDPSDEAIKWSEGCTYVCQKCRKFTTKSKGIFKSHLRDEHKMSVNKYRAEFEKVVTHGKFHLCQLCDGKVVHDEKYLTKHLQQNHEGMTLVAYYCKMIATTHCQCKLCPRAKPTNFSNLETFTDHVKTHHKDMSLAKYNRDVSNPFKNLTLFECDRCSAILISEDTYVNHLKEKHSVTEDEFKEYLMEE